jgi:hypothetical protein
MVNSERKGVPGEERKSVRVLYYRTVPADSYKQGLNSSKEADLIPQGRTSVLATENNQLRVTYLLDSGVLRLYSFV